jgi:hypothetical protein
VRHVGVADGPGHQASRSWRGRSTCRASLRTDARVSAIRPRSAEVELWRAMHAARMWGTAGSEHNSAAGIQGLWAVTLKCSALYLPAAWSVGEVRIDHTVGEAASTLDIVLPIVWLQDCIWRLTTVK